jgi:drug/metabolite transporter (DMT)-like permease
VITFLAPIVACWACAILIHEPFTRKEQIAGFISLIGVCLIARPVSLLPHGWTSGPIGTEAIDDVPLVDQMHIYGVPVLNRITSAQRLSAVGMGLMGVLNAAIVFTSIRWIGKRAHPLLSVNYFGAWTTLASTLIQFYPGIGFRFPSTLREWSLLLFLGVCGFVMQILFTTGMQQEKSSRATNMVYTQMVFALVFDKLVWNSTLSILSIIGSSIILSSAIYIAMQNSARAVTEDKLADGEDDQRYVLQDQPSPVDGVLVEDEEDVPVWRIRTG